jgi:hypothetical protein
MSEPLGETWPVKTACGPAAVPLDPYSKHSDMHDTEHEECCWPALGYERIRQMHTDKPATGRDEGLRLENVSQTISREARKELASWNVRLP